MSSAWPAAQGGVRSSGRVRSTAAPSLALEELVLLGVVTDLDGVDAVVAADLRPHAASSARTTSPASRAAERGLWRWRR